MAKQMHVDPATYARVVREALKDFNRGNARHAKTLAMCAGVSAAILGLGRTECPFSKPGHLELEIKWSDGLGYGLKANDNKEQRSLL